MVNDQVPYDVVRKVLGHTDPDAIEHYARPVILRGDEAKEIADGLGAVL